VCIFSNSCCCLFVALFSVCCSYTFPFSTQFLWYLTSASHCIVFIFLFLRSFFSFCTSCSRCCQLLIAFFHFGVLGFLFFSAHFSQRLMLTFLCILSILLFFIFFLMHTSCIFCYQLFIAFFLTINFSSSAATLLFQCISILHVAMKISFPSTCFFLVFSFIFYRISFLV